MLRLIVMYSVAFYTLCGTIKAQCPASWITIGDSCYMNQSVLHNYSDAQLFCDTLLKGSKLAVLEINSETAGVFNLLRLTNEARYAIGPFPPCGNDTCYFVIGQLSGEHQVGSTSCGSPLPFICEGEPFYEDPKQVESVDPPTTTTNSITISWERPDNVSSYRVSLEKIGITGLVESRDIDAGDPRELTFSGLDGGSQYRAVIYSVNGPKESEPFILDFCTIPIEVQCVQHYTKRDLILSWTPANGRVHEYRIETNVTDKDGRPFDPVYTSRLEQTFKEVGSTTEYGVKVQAVVWFNGQELRSTPYVHHVVREAPVSKEDFSEQCDNAPDVKKTASPVPNDAEEVTVSNIAADSLTVNWTSRSNFSSFHVTAVDIEGHSPNAKKLIEADDPKIATFDSLQGGTEYTVAVFTFNGSMESDPVTLTVATIPMQIPAIRAEVKEEEITVAWDDAPDNADGYFFELVGALDKEDNSVAPIYSTEDEENIKFNKLRKYTDYTIRGYSVLWFKGTRQLSLPKHLDVKTRGSGGDQTLFNSESVTRPSTLSPTTRMLTTAAPVLFCPQINYEPPTTQVPSTTASITTVDLTTQTTTERQTTQETTQPTTTQVEPTTTQVPLTTPSITTVESTTRTTTSRLQTTQQQLTTRQTSEEPSTPQHTTARPTTKPTAPPETTTPTLTTELISTPSACETIFHAPFNTDNLNSSLLYAQQTLDFVNDSLNFFFDQFEEGILHPEGGSPNEIINTWKCVYGTNIMTEREVELVPDLLEALLQGFLTNAKWASTTQVKGHPFAGGTDVEIWRPDNPSLEGCGTYSRVHTEPSWITFDVPNSAITNNGTVCRSLLVMKMEKVDQLLPQSGCWDEGEFQCDKLETPFPLVTVALGPVKPAPFTEPVTVGFQLQDEVPGMIPVCVWVEKKIHASSESFRRHSWNSSGCDTVIEKGAIICRCYHLTSFSVIMRVSDYKVDEGHKRALHVISMLGCITTIVCACLTIAIYVYLRILKEERIIHTQFLSSIALSQLIFLIGIDMIKYQVLCKVISIALLYFFSATFTWMLVETCHLYMSVVRVFSSGSKFKLYFLAGWGLPVISVVITSAVGLSRDELISSDYCWLTIQSGLIWGFVGPALVIILVNTVMLVAVLREISSLIERDITKMKANKFKTTAKAMLVFMPMVGLPWIFGVLSLNSSLIIFDYIFTILNSFQGLLLFMILIVGNKEVRNKIQGRIDDLDIATGRKATGCDNGVSVVPSTSTTNTYLSEALQKKSRTDEEEKSCATPWTGHGTNDEGDVTVTSLENACFEDLGAI